MAQMRNSVRRGILKKNQRKLLEMAYSIFQKYNQNTIKTLNLANSLVLSIYNLEHNSSKISHLPPQKKDQRLKTAFAYLLDVIQRPKCINLMNFQGVGENGLGKLFSEVTVETVPNLNRDMNDQIKEMHRTCGHDQKDPQYYSL